MAKTSEPVSYYGPCRLCGKVHGGWEQCDPPAGARCTVCGEPGFCLNQPGAPLGWTCLTCKAPYDPAEPYAAFSVRITRIPAPMALHGWMYRAECVGTYTGTTVVGESPIAIWALMRAMHGIADAMHDQPPIALAAASTPPGEED